MVFSLIQSCLIGSVPFSLSMNVNFNVILVCAGVAVTAAGGLWLILKRQRERARADVAHRPISDQKSNRFLDEMSDRLTLTEEEETLLITMSPRVKRRSV